ncbi:MAG: CDP-alcohol phosphatidyltransferase family protein [Bacteroidales bacterium]
MQIKKNIPNFITSMNLFCGSLAIVQVFSELYVWAAIFAALAAIFDFLDGFTARLLQSYSKIGKDLDSLADMVSFGFLPSTIIYQYLNNSISVLTLNNEDSILQFLPYLAFSIAVFSALRLSIFNLDNQQEEKFIGLPTPANAIFILSIPLVLETGQPDTVLFSIYHAMFHSPILLLAITALSSFLLVSNIPMLSLKFKNFSFNQNLYRYILLFTSFLFILFLGFSGLPLIILFYVLLSVIENMLSK